MLVIVAALMLQTAAPDSTPSPKPTSPATPVPQQEYQVGVSTLPDVIAKLGKPGSITSMSDGSKIAAWVSTRAHAKASSYVPIVGLFAGGAKSHVSIKVFTFGPDGLLKSFTSTESNGDCNVGVLGADCH